MSSSSSSSSSSSFYPVGLIRSAVGNDRAYESVKVHQADPPIFTLIKQDVKLQQKMLSFSKYYSITNAEIKISPQKLNVIKQSFGCATDAYTMFIRWSIALESFMHINQTVFNPETTAQQSISDYNLHASYFIEQVNLSNEQTKSIAIGTNNSVEYRLRLAKARSQPYIPSSPAYTNMARETTTTNGNLISMRPRAVVTVRTTTKHTELLSDVESILKARLTSVRDTPKFSSISMDSHEADFTNPPPTPTTPDGVVLTGMNEC